MDNMAVAAIQIRELCDHKEWEAERKSSDSFASRICSNNVGTLEKL